MIGQMTKKLLSGVYLLIRILVVLWMLNWIVSLPFAYYDYYGPKALNDVIKESLLRQISSYSVNIPYNPKMMVKDIGDTDLEEITDKEWQEIDELLYKRFYTAYYYYPYNRIDVFPMRVDFDRCISRHACFGFKIIVDDIVFTNSKLIQNLIKVASSPCSYFVDTKKFDQDGKEIVNFGGAESAKCNLGCNKNILEKFFIPLPEKSYIKLEFTHDYFTYPPIFIKRQDVSFNPFSIIMPVLVLFFMFRRVFLWSKSLIFWVYRRIKSRD